MLVAWFLGTRIALASPPIPLDAPDAPDLTVLLNDSAELLDDRAPTDARVAAAHRLSTRGDVRALQFLRAALRSREPEVRAAAVTAAARWREPEAVEILHLALQPSERDPEVQSAAVAGLVAMQIPAAGAVLWESAGDRHLRAALRREALGALRAHYPEELKRLGEPRAVSDWLGATAGIAANGMVGGIMLSSVGVWGKTNTGVAVGAAGGSAIGLGTGGLYVGLRPISRGQGLLYASDASWGLLGGLATTWALYGWGYQGEDRERREDMGALLRTVGTVGGAGLAWARLPHEPSASDVLEIDGGGYLGAQLALGLSDLLTSQPRPDECWWEERTTDTWTRDTTPSDTPYYEESAVRDGDGSQISCFDTRRDQRLRRRSTAGLLGGAAGLGVGLLVRDAWEPTWQGLGFASAVAAEGAWIGGWMPTALGIEEPEGNIRVGGHTGAAAGLIFDHFFPQKITTAGQVAFGAVTANAIGAGVPFLAGSEDDQIITAIMLPVGAVGAVAGGVLAPRVQLTGGDVSMVAVGTALTVAEAATLGFILDEKEIWVTPTQPVGLVLTAGGAAGIAFEALATQRTPRVRDSLFLGSAAGWGSYAGFLFPIALDTDGTAADHALVTMLTADAFLGAAGLAISPVVGMDARDTLLPQMGALAGGTLGTLAVTFSSDKPRDMARGALIGAAAGAGVGAVVRAVVPERERVALVPSVPRLDLPGDWGVSAAPTILEDGASGVLVSLDVRGL